MSTFKTLMLSIPAPVGVTLTILLLFKSSILPVSPAINPAPQEPHESSKFEVIPVRRDVHALESPITSDTKAAATPVTSARAEAATFAKLIEEAVQQEPPTAEERLAYAEEAYRQEYRDPDWAAATERELARQVAAISLPANASVSTAVCRRNTCKLEIAALDEATLRTATQA